MIAVKVYIITFCKGCNYFISFIQAIFVKVREKSGFCGRGKVVFWAFSERNFVSMTNGSLLIGRKKEKELSGSIGMKKF